MEQIKVYIASKREHAAKLAAICMDGIHINSRWIDTVDIGRARSKPVTHWQQENFDDIAAAHFVVFYIEPSDDVKGALFEVGYAVGIGKRVWIAGDGHGVEVEVAGATLDLPHKTALLPWGLYRQAIRISPSLEEALRAIKRLVRPEPEADGT